MILSGTASATPRTSAGRRHPVRAFVPVAAAIAVLAYVWIYAALQTEPPVRSDGFSYFVYLPAAIVYHDTTLEVAAEECCGGRFPGWTAIVRWPETGRWVNAHPVGVAVLLLPFYLAGHALTVWSNLPPDGFSMIYQHAAGLGGVAYLVAGLLVLRRALLRWFTPGVTLATLVTITFGTNLLHYGTYDSVYSHVFSFFLICCLIDQVPRWFERPRATSALIIGVVAGLIVLVRHPNVLYLALIPLFGLFTTRTPGQQVRTLLAHWPHPLLMAGACALVAALQLAIYYSATGRLFVSSYGDMWFNFASPQLYGVLFSVQKGVFFWSPVLLLAIVGFTRLRGEAAGIVAPAAFSLPVLTYIIASWWDWQYGGSYGHRGFTDALGLFAVGLAGFFRWIAPRPRVCGAVGVAVALAVALSLAQMVQYWFGTLPISDLTWAQYTHGFLRFR